ncbi:energy-coupling factor ABC transporter ATP-binding protein [Alkaliphilus transvaalensis]|uniref:energy-coupling factor ABC transporter ATP-binding protein n=1 Tax=Alkaliphilus transvaalensis TaxID=114628 RepID=UPI00047B5C30|nr:ATP-binding cassette domain-containing protein [Alkaliphilus transvaalensis]
MKAIEICNLNYMYQDGTVALHNISLSIDIHKKIALLGSNGSGKTTLLYHLNGLNLPQEGTVKVFGNLISDDNLKVIRKSVGIVFDNPDNQLFATTVYEDLAFGPRNLGYNESIVKDKVTTVLQEVGMETYKERPPFNLSLGQKKKIAIAGVLIMEPEILVLDEPFSGLDPASSKQLEGILRLYHDKGATIIISTHDVDFAYSWADEVIILHHGQLLAKGSIDLLKDKKLMEDGLLEVPTIPTIFESSNYSPKTSKEANEIILNLINKIK